MSYIRSNSNPEHAYVIGTELPNFGMVVQFLPMHEMGYTGFQWLTYPEFHELCRCYMENLTMDNVFIAGEATLACDVRIEKLKCEGIRLSKPNWTQVIELSTVTWYYICLKGYKEYQKEKRKAKAREKSI